jgi:dipeptidyl aminopeptidase/acylaminoacyl peptidase
LLALLVAAVVLAGCSVPRPPGDSPLRYRDQVFSNVSVTRDIQYGSAPDRAGNPVALRLDLYQPVGDTQTKRPVLIWVHGGSFCCGDKIAADMVDLSNTFAKLGYVTASINYRLLATQACNGNNVTPDCITAAFAAQHDAQAAVRWFRANAATYRVDPTRIGMGGSSAGAVISTMVGINSTDPGDSGNPGPSSKIGGFMSLSGGVPPGYEAFFDSADAPGILFHGTADTVVPPSFAEATAWALVRAGVAAYPQPLEGAGHVPYTQYRSQIVTQSDYFFYKHLDLAHAQGQPAG